MSLLLHPEVEETPSKTGEVSECVPHGDVKFQLMDARLAELKQKSLASPIFVPVSHLQLGSAFHLASVILGVQALVLVLYPSGILEPSWACWKGAEQ